MRLFCQSARSPQKKPTHIIATLPAPVDRNGATEQHIHSCDVLINSFTAVPALLVSFALDLVLKSAERITKNLGMMQNVTFLSIVKREEEGMCTSSLCTLIWASLCCLGYTSSIFSCLTLEWYPLHHPDNSLREHAVDLESGLRFELLNNTYTE